MNYQFYSVQELMHDPWFRTWVLRENYEADRFWREFQDQFPHRTTEVAAARALLLALHESQPFPSPEQGQKMWREVKDQTDQLSMHQPNSDVDRGFRARPLRRWLSAAAVVVFILGLGWRILSPYESSRLAVSDPAQDAASNERTHRNTTTQAQKIQLPDGSRMVLDPGSQVRFKNDSKGNKREIYLSGRGYFEVVKDHTKPFLVFADHLVTKVVGTSFTVNAFQNKATVSVEVKSGTVHVYTLKKFREAEQGKAEDKVVLTANQQVRYDVAKNDFVPGIMLDPAVIKVPEMNPDFNFTNVAVPDVFTTLEEAYGVHIEFDRQVLSGCHITAPLKNETLFRKLDIVCQTIGATYEVWGTRIVVTGPGCTP